MTGSRDRSDKGDFERIMGSDVTRTPDRNHKRPPPAPAVKPTRRREVAPTRFEIEEWGERVEGVAQGIDRQLLARIKRGELPAEARIDLHGLDVEGARQRVIQGIEASQQHGQRCVALIHGRGLHSGGEPVLKQAVVNWVTTPPLASRVMVFASAPPSDGGTGALYVYLRKRRQKQG